MGNIKNTLRPAPGLIEVAPAKMAQVAELQDATLAAQDADDVATAYIGLGHIEAATFFLYVGDAVVLAAYEKVKKSKGWQHIRNPQSSYGKNFESLDEFCRVKLGKSYNRIQAIAANRRFIGQEAFEQAERIGLRQVDYNALKALPAPKQEIVREALAEGASKEEVQRALRELAAADQKEIAALTKERDDLRAEAATTQEVLDKKNQRIDKLEREKGRIARLPPDKALAATKTEAENLLKEAIGLLRGNFRQALVVLSGLRESIFMAGMVGQVQAELVALRDEFSLADVVGDGTPEWQRWDAAQGDGQDN